MELYGDILGVVAFVGGLSFSLALFFVISGCVTGDRGACGFMLGVITSALYALILVGAILLNNA